MQLNRIFVISITIYTALTIAQCCTQISDCEYIAGQYQNASPIFIFPPKLASQASDSENVDYEFHS